VLPDDLTLGWMFMKTDEKRITELATYQMRWINFKWYTLFKDYKTPDLLKS
jgi:hypothetical protein